MQPKNKGRKRILRTNASVSGPIKVRNLKTGELAIYTPDKLQPTIPVGWVPLNSNRQQSRSASRNFRRNSGLVVQTCGNQYRILNSSRKVVAQGKLNASADGDDEYWRSNLSNIWKNKAAQWMDEDSFKELSEIFVEKTGWYPVDQGKYPDQVIATATPDGKGEKHLFTVTEETAGLGKYGEEFEDLGPVDDTSLDSSRLNANLDEDYDSMLDDMGDFEETIMQRVNEILSEHGYWSEPSTQAGRGTDFIFDENDRQVGSINYEDEVRKLNEILQYSEDEEAAAQEMANWMMGFINDENPDNEDF